MKVKGSVFIVAVVGSTSAANKVRIFAFLLGVREWGGP